MDQLPQEILDHIVAFLPKSTEGGSSPLTALASTSRRMNKVAEPATFRGITVTATDTDAFSKIFASRPQRRCFLRHLDYHVKLPAYSDEKCAEYETGEERAENNRIATEAIHRLLGILSQWTGISANIYLNIHIYSPMDNTHRGQDKLRAHRHAAEIGRRRDLFEKRYEYSFMEISDCPNLPTVACVHSVYFYGRTIQPASIVDVSAKFPNMTYASWELELPGYYLPFHRHLRQELARSLKISGLPLSAEKLCLKVLGTESEHSEQLPSFAGPEGVDVLSENMHHLIGNQIKSLDYQGQIHPSFFWPYSVSEPAPFWTSLEQLEVSFEIGSPSGRWCFKGKEDDPFYVRASDEPLPSTTLGHWPPGYGTAEEDQAALAYVRSLDPTGSDGTFDGRLRFRRVPNDDVILPLIESFARALRQMPALKFAYLSTWIDTLESTAEWSITYGSPGTPIEYGPHGEVVPRVLFHVGDWRPSEEVLEILRDVGRRQHNQETVIRFLPFAYGGEGF